jgi:acetyl-CoA carboxylase beta subunit
MLRARFGGAAGRTRTCPHCKATILESAAVCPQCRHHLRFSDTAAAPTLEPEGFSALKVEGTVHHPQRGGDWEYSVVLSIRNEKGEEISRQVVGVGALRETQSRTFTLSVEVLTPGGRPQ